MAALPDSNSSDGDDEDFEGFIVSPEEKASYRVWSRKRRASNAFDSDSESEDDDDKEDEEEDGEDEESEELDAVLGDVNLHESGEETPSSNTDQCPVCLMSLKEQLLGTPNNCPHVFCYECIQEWSKNANTCPVGRKPYTEILVHASRKGPVLQRIPVEERIVEDELEDDPTYCELCGLYDREERMLLCDGCDNGYHMECLTPPVEFVPIEEWYCPTCSTQQEGYGNPEGFPQEGHREGGLREVPRGRPRGRPRGSTSRRISVSERTAPARRARTVASTRGRGRTRTAQGRVRARSSSRGRGRGGSSRGRSDSTTTGRKRKRKKKRNKNKKRTGTSSTRKEKKSSKGTTVKGRKRRRVIEEDEVSPFIYEPVRRGRTVHARLLESLNATGPSAEPGRSPSLGRAPFPNRIEPSSSFSLFGNAYALYDFDDREDTRETARTEVQGTVLSSASTNPDVLGSIFQNLDSLHSPGVQVARDGKLVKSTDQRSTKDVKNRDAKSVSNMDEIKNEVDLEIEQRPDVVGNLLDDEEKRTKTMNSVKHSSSGKQDDKQGKIEIISDELSPSNSSEKNYAVSCRKLSDAGDIQDSSRGSSNSSPPLIPLSLKPTLSGFRIPKRSSISEDKPNQTPSRFHGGSSSANQIRSKNFSVISNFKIPKRTSLSCEGNPTEALSDTVYTKRVKSVGQAGATLSSSTVKPANTSFYGLSQDKVVSQSCPKSKDTESSRIYFNSVMTRKDSRSKSPTVPGVTSVTGVTKCHANNVTSVTHRHTTSSRAAALCVTSTRNTTASTTKAAGAYHCYNKTINISPPLSKTVPIINQPPTEKEQRRSNIEIIRMLNEKQKSMRKQMLGDRKCTSVSGDLAGARALQQKGLCVSEKSPKCGIAALPIAVVKPSLHTPNAQISSSSSVRCNSLENSPVKSIASGIIDAHSGNTQEFKKVRSEFDSPASLGCEISGSGVGLGVGAFKRDREVETGAHCDREQQRKLGIARLQRHEQIVDEVKLALKPFFRHEEITKDEYKIIMRKSVEKIKESSSSVDRERVSRLVKKYIKKIKGDKFSGW